MQAQRAVNRLQQSHPQLNWFGVINRLWTFDRDLAEYRDKFAVQHPLQIDKSNRLLHRFAVSSLPVLLLIRQGKVVGRVTDFSSTEAVAAQLDALQ